MIIEESENLKLERIATVKTDRNEVLINVDRSVSALAQIISDYDNNMKMGWTLEPEWFMDKFHKLENAARSNV